LEVAANRLFHLDGIGQAHRTSVRKIALGFFEYVLHLLMSVIAPAREGHLQGEQLKSDEQDARRAKALSVGDARSYRHGDNVLSTNTRRSNCERIAFASGGGIL
jgi:hypothetical protein